MSTRTFTFSVTAAPANELESAAAGLPAGHSVLLGTVPDSALIYPGESNVHILKYSTRMVYDSSRGEVRFIGRRDGTGGPPYHMAVYTIATNTWEPLDKYPMWAHTTATGHGYDHNAFDQATGTHYFREFFSQTIRVWNGAWSTLTCPYTLDQCGGLAWFPGVGLCINDGRGLVLWNGATWSKPFTTSTGSIHDISVYNSTANVLIFGGGNTSKLWKWTGSGAPTEIPGQVLGGSSGTTYLTPLGFGLSNRDSSVDSQMGLAVSDPRSASIICHKRFSNYDWGVYDINAGTWTSLTPCAGTGGAGAPNIPAAMRTDRSMTACTLDDYGVMMFVKYSSTANASQVWLYKHTGP